MFAKSLIGSLVALVTLAGSVGCSAAPQGEGQEEGQEEAVGTTGQALSAEPAVTAASNCKDAGGGLYHCVNNDTEVGWNQNAYALLRNVYAWGDQKVEVTNTSSHAILAFSAQGLNRWSDLVRLEPGQKTVLTRLDAIYPLYTTLFIPVDKVDGGTVTVDARVLASSAAPQAVGSQADATPAPSNCEDVGNGVFSCSNRQNELIWNQDAFAIFRDLGAWGDGEKVAVKNTGAVPVYTFAAQGMNRRSDLVKVAPGESTTITRLDAIAPFYTALFTTDEGVKKGEARIEARIVR